LIEIREEFASRKAKAWVERNIVDGLLNVKRPASIHRLPNEVLHIRIRGIVPVVKPTGVNSARRCSRRPREEMVLHVVEWIVVHSRDCGSSGVHVYAG